MSNRYPGGFITAAEPDVSVSSADGVWTLTQQAEYLSNNQWPFPYYTISRSLRFNSADSAYLGRTPASAGNRRTWTYSFWMKRALISSLYQEPLSAGNASGNGDGVSFNPSNQITIFASGGSALYFVTSQVFRDVSSWYHIVVSVDTTQATSTDRVKLYVNGTQVTAFSTATYPSQNFEFVYLNTTTPQRIGTGYNYLDGYLAEINFIDGQALTPSSFGQTNSTTGVWEPIRYAGSYGTNGFYLNFSDNSGTTSTTLGKDYSGNGNNWTPNNFSVTAGAGNDSLVDTPTPYGTDTGVGGEVRGNYCTLNTLAKGGSFTNAPTNGNLDVISAASPNYGTILGTFGLTSGKWYWEILNNAGTAAQSIGLAKDGVDITNWLGSNAFGWTYLQTGSKQTNGTGSSYGASYTTNDIIGVAFDADAGALTFYKNGVSQGTAFTGLTSGPYYPALSDDSGGNQANYTANFGQRPFAYTAPSGFKALCTQNLPETTVVQGDDYFNTVLYTGTGASLSVTGVGFQPDFTWIKERSGAADHGLYDVVRGVQKQLESNTTSAETTETTGLTAFGSDGFTVGALAQVNTSADTYVSWNWKANGSGSSNTAGTITSTVSANTTSGFSIVTYLNASGTVGHGLGVAPKMIIYKDRDNGSNNWVVTHTSLATMNNDYLVLNTTGAAASGLGLSANPTSTVFSTSTALGGSGNKFVAYCFAPVAGYSAFGSYTGNGSADGPFVYTGFRPAFVLIKSSSGATGNWMMYDDTRVPYNLDSAKLAANLSDAENSATLGGSTLGLDLLSNGFKNRNDGGANHNTSGATYIYAAFAESPFKYSLAR